jgi:hypothetical protein
MAHCYLVGNELSDVSPGEASHIALLMTRAELVTALAALDSYAQDLQKQVNEATAKLDYEETSFCYEFLSKINRIKFGVFDDHTPEEAATIRKWIDWE